MNSFLAFWQHAKQRYVKHGRPTSEIRSFRTALQPVRQLYGRQPVSQFRPAGLGRLSPETDRGWHLPQADQSARTAASGRCSSSAWPTRVVPESVWRALCAVEGVAVTEKRPNQTGQAGFRGTHRGDQTLRHAAGGRHDRPSASGRAVVRGKPAWCVPSTLTRRGRSGNTGRIPIKASTTTRKGWSSLVPHAQAILKPWLKKNLHAYVFSPAEGRAWYQTLRAANRKTPKPRGRQSSRKKSPPMRAPGDHYTSLSYGHAVQRACEVAYLASCSLCPSWLILTDGPLTAAEDKKRLQWPRATFYRQHLAWLSCFVAGGLAGLGRLGRGMGQRRSPCRGHPLERFPRFS